MRNAIVGVACRAGWVPDDLNALEWRRSSGSGMCGEHRTGKSCLCTCSRCAQPRAARV